jgi:glycerol-3-phosphate acyltransferase PlsY
MGVPVDFAAILLASYVVGSLPTAYLAVRFKSGIDIRKAGSGNVGAFNTFDVTKSKSVGIIVGLIDALKGFLVTATLAWVFKTSFELQAVGLFGVIIGHNYPVWLKFKGGRGLATGAGGLFAIGVAYTIVWCIVWFVVYRLKKDIHTGNLVAILAAPLLLLPFPGSWIESLTVSDCTASGYRLLAYGLSAVLLLSHIDVVIKSKKQMEIGK